jgi:broad specificity phosphatase PhoE
VAETKIIIIRHAEKPNDDTDPHLAPAGWKRAWALSSNPGLVGPPSVIFAAAASLGSNRPVETISPLAAALGLSIDATISDHEIERLSAKLRALAEGTVALVCWHHERIPKLARELGVSNAPRDYGDVYDQVWELTAAKYTFPAPRTSQGTLIVRP